MNWGPAIESINVVRVAGVQRPPFVLEGTPHVVVADEAFHAVLEASDRLSNVLAHLEDAEARYCVFGGWLRDTLSARARGTPLPRDVDLVVGDLDVATLAKLLPADVRPTMFGGIQSFAPPIPFDIWPLHETFLIRVLRLPPSFENLLRTADFDINAALYFPSQGSLASSMLDAGMLAALDAKLISFNASDLPFPVLQCARLAAYAAKLDFDFAQPVLEFMREILADRKNQVEVVAGLERYQSGPIAEKAIGIVKSIVQCDI